MNKNHKEVDVQSRLKVVISLLSKKFSGVADETVKSALGAIDYAAKEVLRLSDSVTGTGTILGNVMVLDLSIPLSTSYSSDVTKHYDEFNRKVTDYLMNGKTHVTSGSRLGGFGSLNVGYVGSDPSTDRIVNLVVETESNDSQLRQALRGVASKVEIR